jgi:hypothetical protein
MFHLPFCLIDTLFVSGQTVPAVFGGFGFRSWPLNMAQPRFAPSAPSVCHQGKTDGVANDAIVFP